MNSLSKHGLLFLLTAVIMLACGENNSNPAKEMIGRLSLKRGKLISCGPPQKEFGIVDFDMPFNEKVKKDFNVAIELLHSFEYDESEKVFAKIIDESPGCAMAYWGVAMCNFHPLWEPPTPADLKKGEEAIEIAKSITGKSETESDYINAVAAYYEDWNKKIDFHLRAVNFENAMRQLHRKYPDDKEAAIFYALALDAAALPTDKTYSNQKKAGEILNALYIAEPNHPGIIHYIIHTYDYPGIAHLGLHAARRYAEVAPSSAHALHMPSHIFVRLGLWDDCIKSNTESIESAQCYAESAGIKGHWDEELHGLDYLVYAYLQKGDNKSAEIQLKYSRTIDEVYPVNLKGAYAFAAIPSRIALENKNWNEASTLQYSTNFPWNKFPWQEAIIHFARLLGNVHLGKIDSANSELAKLIQLRDTLQKQKELYRSNAVGIQIKESEAWIKFATNHKTEALNLMSTAADMEDSTSKHPVTPGPVLPARELYADMLLQIRENENALQAYETVLQSSPNRFNSLYGAGVAAERLGETTKTIVYYKQLLTIANTNSNRPELSEAKAFLKKYL